MIQSHIAPTLISRQKSLFVGSLLFVVFSVGLIQWRLNTGLLNWLPRNITSIINKLYNFKEDPYQAGDSGGEDWFQYQTDGKRLLIYICNAKDACGGLADRQRGIVSTFLLAIVTRRRFGISFDKPCNITQVYLPNRYNWVIEPNVLRNKSSRIVAAIDNGNPAFYFIRALDFNALYPEDVLYIRTNKAFQWQILENPSYRPLVPSWANQPWHVFLKNAWAILTKPAPVIQTRLETFLESIGYKNRSQPLVCVHIRIGTSSTWKDTRSFNNVAKLGPVWNLVTSYVQNGSQLFLATDNTEVRNISRTRYGAQHHDLATVIVHVDKAQNDAESCRGFQDAALDQLVLSHGDVLVTSRSGFSETAAVLRGSNTSLYKFFKDRLTVESFASIYSEGHQ